MSKDDAKQVMKQKDFEQFIKKSVNIVERALNQEYDIMGKFFNQDEKDQINQLDTSKHEKMQHLFTFQEGEQIKRSVTSMQWSQHVKELMLVSYSRYNEWKVDEPDG